MVILMTKIELFQIPSKVLLLFTRESSVTFSLSTKSGHSYFLVAFDRMIAHRPLGAIDLYRRSLVSVTYRIY